MKWQSRVVWLEGFLPLWYLHGESSICSKVYLAFIGSGVRALSTDSAPVPGFEIPFVPTEARPTGS